MSEQLRRAARQLQENRKAGEALARRVVEELIAEPDRSGCTATELASRLGISKQYLSDVMAGRRSVTDDLVARILEAR